MGKGELVMVMLYLHRQPNPNYIREMYTTTLLHLPRDSSTLLHLTYHAQQAQQTHSSYAESRQRAEGWEKMRRRHEHRVTSHSKLGMRNKANLMGSKGERKL